MERDLNLNFIELYKILCKHCKKENVFESANNIPAECEFCAETLDGKDISNADTKRIAGLILTHLKTKESIKVGTEEKTLVGIHHTGSDVLMKFLNHDGEYIISRKHCSFTFKEGLYFLKDEGSTNKTRYTENKYDCVSKPYIVDDKSIIYLGPEAFEVTFIYKTEEEIAKSAPRKIIKYRCNEPFCGNESETYQEVCPKCKSYRTYDPVYE